MQATRSARQFWYATVVLALSGGLAIGAMFGVIWWQERPLSEAEQALEANQPDEALHIVDRFLHEHPQHGRALAIRARALVAQKRWSEASRIFEQVGAATAEDLHALATVRLRQQQWAHALALLERVVQLEPRHADALHEMTACRANLGDLTGAISTAEQLAQIPGSEAAAYLQIAMLHEELGNYQSAVSAWEQLLHHRSDASDLAIAPHEVFAAYGSSLHNIGRSQNGLHAVNRSLELRPTAVAYTLRGQIELALGKRRGAIESWKRAVQLEPNSQLARISLAQAALQDNAPHETIEWLGPIMSSDSINSSTAFLLQRAYILQKDPARAAEWQQRAESLRKQEQLGSAINQALRESPLSFWSQVIYAHRFATEGNWGQAEVIVQALLQQAPAEPFVQELHEAVRRREPPPPLDKLPTQQF